VRHLLRSIRRRRALRLGAASQPRLRHLGFNDAAVSSVDSLTAVTLGLLRRPPVTLGLLRRPPVTLGLLRRPPVTLGLLRRPPSASGFQRRCCLLRRQPRWVWPWSCLRSLGRVGDPGCLVVFADDSCGGADGDAVAGDVVGHDGPGANGDVFSNSDPREHHRVRAKPRAGPDRDRSLRS
jgi:hypothetical protein